MKDYSRRSDATSEQQNLFGTEPSPMPEGDACHIVSVGKRRDGGTRLLVPQASGGRHGEVRQARHRLSHRAPPADPQRRTS